MGEKKTLAERLREHGDYDAYCTTDVYALALTGEVAPCIGFHCDECRREWAYKLADAIETEQAERPHEVDGDVDVDALLRLADHFENLGDGIESAFIALPANFYQWRDTIRDAVKDAKAQLPDGIEWPRFEDGELVKFGDAVDTDGPTINHVSTITIYENGRFRMHGTSANSTSDESIGEWCFRYGEPVKRPEPEVLDADGVPIKVGDTVWYEGEKFVVVDVFRDGVNLDSPKKDECGFAVHSVGNAEPDFCTHRKPDTFESVAAEMIAEWDENNNEYLDMNGYFARFRNLLGGE